MPPALNRNCSAQWNASDMSATPSSGVGADCVGACMKSSHVLSSLFANASVGLVLSSCGFELKIVAASLSET
jgi:hypothetical protein